MGFWTTIGRLLRRKSVVIPAVLIALGLGAAVYVTTPVRYVSSTLMVLTTTQFGGSESRDPTKPTDITNPLLNFNDSLTTTSAILIQAMNTKGVATKLGADGSTKLVIDDGRTNPDLLGLNGPFLYIKAQSPTPSEAKLTVLGAQALMRTKLQSWQQQVGAPKKTYVSLADVVSPTAPTADRSRGTKLALMALIFGFLLSMGIAYFRERAQPRRRARREAKAAAAGSTGLGDRPFPGSAPAQSAASVTVPEVDLVDAATLEVPTPLEKGPEPAISQTSGRKSEPSVELKRSNASSMVRAPVKANVRSRNR